MIKYASGEKVKLDLDEYNETPTWEYFELIDEKLDNLYWYDREIYKLYYSPDGETLDSLAKKTGISRKRLFTTIDNELNEEEEK